MKARIELEPLEPDRHPDDDQREQAFLTLPPSQRMALLLRDAQGLTYAEIGHVLGFGRWVLPHWMVRRLIYNARESIRLAVLHTPAAGGVPTTLVMEEA